MHGFLGLFSSLFVIWLHFSPTLNHPFVSENDLFLDSPEAVQSESPSLDDGEGSGTNALLNTNVIPQTDLLAFAPPPSTDDVGASLQTPSDLMEMDIFNTQLSDSVDSPVLLAADYDWDWDCPDGKMPLCCSQRHVDVFDPRVFGDCRDCGCSL